MKTTAAILAKVSVAAGLLILSACASFRPSEDLVEEKRTGIRTMIGPIFAISQPQQKAEAAAKADCFKDGKTYKLVEVLGARKSQIRYRCVSQAPGASMDGQEIATQ